MNESTQLTTHFDSKESRIIAIQNFAAKLNKEPNPSEFDKTPDGKASHLPISFIEMTLDELYFGLWETANFKWSAITNEVQGSIELIVTHPITGEKITRVGAASIVITVDSLEPSDKERMSKQDRNLYALNPENKKPNALDLGFPKLKAECLKNAAASLGKIFGRDINRKKKDVFKPVMRPLSDDEFAAGIKRIQDGKMETIELMENNFILSSTQKEILYGEALEFKNKQLESHG